MTEETATKHAIKDYLSLKGIFWWYNLAGMGAFKGIPDLFAVHKGMVYGIEVKATKGKMSAHQTEFESKLNWAGGIYLLARSLDDVMMVIK